MNNFDFGDFKESPELESRYWVDDSPLSCAFGSILPPKLADLVDLAMAVYFADRRSKRQRQPNSFELTGHRQIHIRLPVRELELWKSREITSSLIDLLGWFTEDAWEFEFLKLTARRKSEYEESLFSTPVAEPNISLLFSGGLDSLAGLCTLMDTDRDCSFVLVSGCTSKRMGQIQRDLIRELVRFWRDQSREIRSLVLPFGISKPRDGFHEETSQRSRGFVFLLLGAAAAIMANSKSLYVCENGVGAANLPFNEGQLGIDNTRGVHPLSLAKMSNFLELVLGKSLPIVNPFEFTTKAEMCRVLKKLGLEALIRMTVSCDSFPLRIPEAPAQCGICTSCLLRRCSLHSAGLDNADPGTEYRFDVKKSLAQIDKKELYPLMAMLDQVDRIRTCLSHESPWAMLTQTFPELFEIQHGLCAYRHVATHDIAQSYVRMYRRYVEEWENFPLKVN
jgi:hypothetical protein